jgi:hypothetical protein
LEGGHFYGETKIVTHFPGKLNSTLKMKMGFRSDYTSRIVLSSVFFSTLVEGWKAMRVPETLNPEP